MSVIALLTDFGTKDYFTGAMKGVILSINENVRLVDISHEIAPQNIKSASFNLRACYRNFPLKTIFLAVVDPGVGSERRPILVETGDYYFIAPDNGLLGFALDDAETLRVYQLTNERFFARHVSSTFHGRDIFAPVAAHLSRGVPAAEFGDEITDFVRFEENKPREISAREIEAEIIEIDRFGNLVTNLTGEYLTESFALEINGRRIERLQNYFAEGAAGEPFMIFGSAGFLEIVAFRASAETILGAKIGQKVQLIKL